jgi:hypothetical protein
MKIAKYPEKAAAWRAYMKRHPAKYAAHLVRCRDNKRRWRKAHRALARVQHRLYMRKYRAEKRLVSKSGS